MPSTGGIVSKQELESYGGASVMLMSNGAEPIQTGSASGRDYYTWYLAWNSDGFSGGGWGRIMQILWRNWKV